MEELSKQELAQAKKQARRLRIRNIRRRVAVGAAMMVAVFSGLVLYRSIDQQMASTQVAATRTAEQSSDDVQTSLVDQVASVFLDDDHDDESDDDDDDEESGGLFDSFSPSSSSSSEPAPLTTSQS